MFAAALVVSGCGRFGFSEALVTDAGHSPVSDADATTSPACGPTGDLRIHLAFDETAGLVAYDSSGAGNHGALIGTSESAWTPGRIGNALDFDGVDDRVDAGSATNLDNVTNMTACAWVFVRSYPVQFPTIADKSVDSFVGGWFFYVQSNDTVGFQSNQRKWAIGGNLARNAWQHVCASWDGTAGFAGIRLYQNGANVAHAQTGSNGKANDNACERSLLIGRENDGSFPFDGRIDEFRLYGRVLDDSEIAALAACP